MYYAIAVLHIGIFMTALITVRPHHKQLAEEEGKEASFRPFLAVGVRCYDMLRIQGWAKNYLNLIYVPINTLKFSTKTWEAVKIEVAQIITILLCMNMLISLLMIGTSADVAGIFLIVLLSLMIPFVKYKQLQQKVKERKREILIELPKLLNKLTLLVAAGETLLKAMAKVVEVREREEHNVLITEWKRMIHLLSHQYSFPQAMEEMNRRLAVQEVSLFTNTVLLNYRRGGNDLVVALRGLSQQLWESRKTLTKTMGEEASSKLVFPMIIIFLVVLVIVATPAIMSMQF
ncbi:type II secretion system F family protein [Longirhabdus pacifica]|uniref:type II secretion system F family protein n=1 Tax=Longirhabdus pacifica TaxID=2305227 RepID=UPI001F0BD00B|nr:type II secretion system F family protein [Longirhabdus pacifica]